MQIFILRSGNIVIESHYLMAKLAQIFGNRRDDFSRLIDFIDNPRGSTHL
jgi:hypothetical protein